MRILITAGPTREPIDPVRFLSNRSTGRMGLSIAEVAYDRGHEVQLVLGPVTFQPPLHVDVFAVETTAEMLRAVLDFLPHCDAIIAAAAVCDYRPVCASDRKLKRGELNALELVENPDIAAAVGERREGKPFAIFALETTNGLEHARGKLEKKNADWCVLNSPAAIGAEGAAFTLVPREGDARELGTINKLVLAERLLEAMEL